MVSKKDLNSAELETMRTSTVMTANGEVQTREEVTEMSKNWTYSWPLCFLKKVAQFFLSGNSSRIMGTLTHWTSGQKPHLVYQRVLPQLHLHLLLHHLHHRIQYLMSTDTPKKQYQKEVEVRVKSFGETRCMKPQKPKNKNKNGELDRRSTKRFNAWIAWLTGIQREFGWWKYSNRALEKPRAGKSRQFQVISWTSNGAARVRVSTSVYTHFPKDPNCDICLKTKITRTSWRRRADTVVPRAEHFGDLITADHKGLSEESESRNNHPYAVVVQDLATQSMAREMEPTRHVHNRRRRTRKGPEHACVQTPWSRVAHAGREGRIDVLPWHRLVGVVKTSSETHRKKSPAARKGMWPPRSTANRQAPPILEVRPRLVKTVKFQVRWAGSSPWTRPSAPGCGDTLKALAGDQRSI